MLLLTKLKVQPGGMDRIDPRRAHQSITTANRGNSRYLVEPLMVRDAEQTGMKARRKWRVESGQVFASGAPVGFPLPPLFLWSLSSSVGEQVLEIITRNSH